MVKKYTISASFLSDRELKSALKSLRRMGVESKDIDAVSQLGDKRKSAKILKSHKGFQCLSLGFVVGGLLGGMIRLFMGLDAGVSFEQAFTTNFLLEIWMSISQAAFAGAVVGFVVGRRMIQYILSYREGEQALHHLAMVNVDFEQKDPVVGALEAVAEEVHVIDNNKEIELGLQARE